MGSVKYISCIIWNANIPFSPYIPSDLFNYENNLTYQLVLFLNVPPPIFILFVLKVSPRGTSYTAGDCLTTMARSYSCSYAWALFCQE